MDMELSTIARCHIVMPRLGQLVVNRPGMIGVLALGIIGPVEPPPHAGEVGPAVRRAPPDDARGLGSACDPAREVDHLRNVREVAQVRRPMISTWRPAPRAAAATRASPTGSSRRNSSEYINALGCTNNTRMPRTHRRTAELPPGNDPQTDHSVCQCADVPLATISCSVALTTMTPPSLAQLRRQLW